MISVPHTLVGVGRHPRPASEEGLEGGCRKENGHFTNPTSQKAQLQTLGFWLGATVIATSHASEDTQPGCPEILLLDSRLDRWGRLTVPDSRQAGLLAGGFKRSGGVSDLGCVTCAHASQATL